MLRAESLYPTVTKLWLADVRFEGRTLVQYDMVLRLLQARCPDQRFAEITAPDVRAYVERDKDGRPRSDRTRRQYLSIIGMVYDWALDPEIRLAETNPAARLRAKEPRRPPRGVMRKTWLGEQRALSLVARVRAGGSPLDRRDAFMLGLYLTTGLRASELLTLKWRDVDLANGTLTLIGKNGKMATIALLAPARKLLVAWRSDLVAACGHDAPPHWPLVPWVAHCSTPGFRADGSVGEWINWERPVRDRHRVWAIVKRRAAEAGIAHLAPHDLRRSFAGILDDREVPIQDIRQAMRHTSEATTRVYLEDKPKSISAMDDLDFG